MIWATSLKIPSFTLKSSKLHCEHYIIHCHLYNISTSHSVMNSEQNFLRYMLYICIINIYICYVKQNCIFSDCNSVHCFQSNSINSYLKLCWLLFKTPFIVWWLTPFFVLFVLKWTLLIIFMLVLHFMYILYNNMNKTLI